MNSKTYRARYELTWSLPLRVSYEVKTFMAESFAKACKEAQQHASAAGNKEAAYELIELKRI